MLCWCVPAAVHSCTHLHLNNAARAAAAPSKCVYITETLPPLRRLQNLILFDYDWASANDEIGRAVLSLSDLPPGQERDLWLDVTSESERWGRGPALRPVVTLGVGGRRRCGTAAQTSWRCGRLSSAGGRLLVSALSPVPAPPLPSPSPRLRLQARRS